MGFPEANKINYSQQEPQGQHSENPIIVSLNIWRIVLLLRTQDSSQEEAGMGMSGHSAEWQKGKPGKKAISASLTTTGFTRFPFKMQTRRLCLCQTPPSLAAFDGR